MAKLTESQLRSIIKKELRNVLNEITSSELEQELAQEKEMFNTELDANLNKLNDKVFKSKIYKLIGRPDPDPASEEQPRTPAEEQTLDRTQIANDIISMISTIKKERNVEKAQAALDAYDDARLIANQKFRLNLPMTPY